MTHNPVSWVKRPRAAINEGSTPAISDAQARTLLEHPDESTLKGKRDRAIMTTLLYHGIRREELTTLNVRDLYARKGVPHLKIFGKGNKVRYIPLHSQALLIGGFQHALVRLDLNLFRPFVNF